MPITTTNGIVKSRTISIATANEATFLFLMRLKAFSYNGFAKYAIIAPAISAGKNGLVM